MTRVITRTTNFKKDFKRMQKRGYVSCPGYFTHPPVFFWDFRRKFRQTILLFLQVGSVYFMNSHWDHLDNRFLENTPITSNKTQFDFIS